MDQEDKLGISGNFIICPSCKAVLSPDKHKIYLIIPSHKIELPPLPVLPPIKKNTKTDNFFSRI